MPDEQGLPKREEIAELPRWARVAFAARCARRVQPLFLAAWPEAPREHVEAVDRAIARAEQLCADPMSVRAYEISVDATSARSAAVAANGMSRHVAMASHEAAHAASSAAFSHDANPIDGAVVRAVRECLAAARVLDDRSEIQLRRSVMSDWAEISSRSRGVGVIEPFPVHLLSPLWPEGEPEGWPQETSVSSNRGMPPRQEDLAPLPRKARTLLAIRCLRRLQSLLDLEPRSPVHDQVSQTLGVSTRIVSGLSTKKDQESIGPLGDQFELPAVASHFEMDISTAAQRLASATFMTILYTSDDSSDRINAESSADALNSCLTGLSHWARASSERRDVPALGHGDIDAFVRACWRDYDLLNELTRMGEPKWGDGTPVRTELLGPLWPDGEPEGWPKASEPTEKKKLVLQILVPEDASDKEVDERVGDLLVAASRLHQAYGGSGLVLGGIHVFDHCGSPVGVQP